MKKRRFWILFGVLAALAVTAALLYRPVKRIWRDVSYPFIEHTAAEEQVKAYADSMGLRYSDYPESLIDLLARNSEAEDFVLHYPLRDTLSTEPLSFSRNYVPLMLQFDERWGYTKYGSDFLAITGCGPTCLAMVGYYLTGSEDFLPDKVAAFAEKNGYYAAGYGSSWTLISEGGVKLGLDVTELPLVKSKIVASLEAGKPVILALGPGDFTTTGHYIVLSGAEDGVFRVCDPNSRANSERLWTYEQLEGQIRNIWSIGV